VATAASPSLKHTHAVTRQVTEALSPVEVNLLSVRLTALEASLTPGLTHLNWNSRGIDAFVAVTTKAIQEFQGLHHSVKKSSAILEKLVSGLAAAQLVADVPSNGECLPPCVVRTHGSILTPPHTSPPVLLPLLSLLVPRSCRDHGAAGVF
jgi:hypothetical protein